VSHLKKRKAFASSEEEGRRRTVTGGLRLARKLRNFPGWLLRRLRVRDLAATEI